MKSTTNAAKAARPTSIGGLPVREWASEGEVAALFQVEPRTLLGWRGLGCPYHRDADGGIAYPMPHVLTWRRYRRALARELGAAPQDVPIECALAWKAYQDSREEYLALDEWNASLGPEGTLAPPAVPRWRPNDWNRRGRRAGRFTYAEPADDD